MTNELKAVELFSVGTWKGIPVTKEDLESMVEGFSHTNSFYRPPLKLGHNKEQPLLAEDGLPNAGQVNNLYVKDNKLVGDFTNIPDKIFSLIKKKRYNKVSIELFSGVKLKGKTFKKFLGAVALLGADVPGVLNLTDILGQFSQVFSEPTDDLTIIENKMELSPMDKDKQIQELQEKLAAKDKENEEFKAKLNKSEEDQKNQATEFSNFKKETDKKIEDLIVQNDETKVEAFTQILISDGLCNAGMKPLVSQLVKGSLKQEFSVNDKKLSSEEAIKQLLELAKANFSVNKNESTENVENPDDKKLYAKSEKDIEKYMADHNCSYSEAYTAVSRENNLQ
jgi:hypothetical protein